MSQSSSYATVVKDEYTVVEANERAAAAAQVFGRLRTEEREDPIKIEVFSQMQQYWQRLSTSAIGGADGRLFIAVNALIQTLEHRRNVELPREINTFERYMQSRELTNEEAQHVDTILAVYRTQNPGRDDASHCNDRISLLRTEIQEIGRANKRLEKKRNDNKAKWEELQKTEGRLKQGHSTEDVVHLFDAKIKD